MSASKRGTVQATPALAAALALAAPLAGCTTYAGWEGERPAGGTAVIQGNPRFNAGLPVTIAIRRVGTRDLGPQHANVEVPAGRVRLLVDCSIAGSGATARFDLDVEVEAGGRYRLVADPAPGNQRCGDVRLEAR
jgi:hypothetical protein